MIKNQTNKEIESNKSKFIIKHSIQDKIQNNYLNIKKIKNKNTNQIIKNNENTKIKFKNKKNAKTKKNQNLITNYLYQNYKNLKNESFFDCEKTEKTPVTQIPINNRKISYHFILPIQNSFSLPKVYSWQLPTLFPGLPFANSLKIHFPFHTKKITKKVIEYYAETNQTTQSMDINNDFHSENEDEHNSEQSFSSDNNEYEPTRSEDGESDEREDSGAESSDELTNENNHQNENLLIQWNMNSYKKQFEDLKVLSTERKPLLICLQETMLRPNQQALLGGYKSSVKSVNST